MSHEVVQTLIFFGQHNPKRDGVDISVARVCQDSWVAAVTIL
jgi:hypothetical protein